MSFLVLLMKNFLLDFTYIEMLFQRNVFTSVPLSLLVSSMFLSDLRVPFLNVTTVCTVLPES